ncbi:MAG TPA: hypothetical protein VGV59_15390 [Pyrinomonadaceae bacterium]|nr:hypothetical protein [Pyrinomonadaceae bacterium]
MKYLFIIALFAFVGLLVYWRLRPYIRAARRFFGFVREVQRVNSAGMRAEGSAGGRGGQPRRVSRSDAPQKLVRCATCGTWLPAARAVSLRSSPNVSYCSHECLERAADASHETRRSAS